MASSKRIGFFWGEEKITVVEFDKNVPHQVVSASLGSKTNTPSPFSSSLTEEIHITAILQKLLQDNQITGDSFYVSLPMKEIILRSFIIPYVKHEEIQNVIKFEAKKYIPFDIQDLAFVFYAIPFMEDQTRRLQVIFFAARKEVLSRYERILKQVNGQVTYCEPYMVSLSKALLFKKEIKPTDHLAFLILDKGLGRICFIDKGVPQFIREFPLSTATESEDGVDPGEALKLKIVNEVGNSFDFYTRQFSGDRIDQMMISSDFVQQDLLRSLETELKVKIIKFSSIVVAGSQNNDMDAVYAMGACVVPPMDSLFEFNFLGVKDSKAKLKSELLTALKTYKEIMLVALVSAGLLFGLNIFLQGQLKVTQQQYNQIALKQGVYEMTPIETIEAETLQNTTKLAAFKNIRMKSDMVFVLLRVSSHLPQGALLSDLEIKYKEGANDAGMTIDMKGDVFNGDPYFQRATIYQIISDLKDDKDLAKFFKSVTRGPLNLEEVNGKQTTGFNIQCS